MLRVNPRSIARQLCSLLLQVIQKPEARSLILAMTPVVVSEGMRTGLFCMRDLLFRGGKGSPAGPLVVGRSAWSRRLPAWVSGLVALLVLFWLAARLQPCPSPALELDVN